MFRKFFNPKPSPTQPTFDEVVETIAETTGEETLYNTLMGGSFNEELAEQYFEKHDGLDFEKLNPNIVSNILANTTSAAQLEKYLHILAKHAEKYLRINPPYDPPGFAVIYDMDDFYRFVAPPLFANKNTPTGMLETIYSHIDFNKYNSMKAAKTYFFIASNPNTPQHILKTLCYEQDNLHRNPQILLALTQNLNVPYEWLTDEMFLKKIVYHSEHIVNNIINREEFNVEDVQKIIYGDYHENLIVAFTKTSHATEEDRIYAALKFGQ
jgi:hypothetical protein